MCDNENIRVLINTFHKLPQAVALLAYSEGSQFQPRPGNHNDQGFLALSA
jgi:hypothetical protein